MKNFKNMIALILSGIVFASCTHQNQTSTSPETPEVTQEGAQTGDISTTVKTYTLVEVGLHNSKANCWLAIEGKVYDATAYIESQKHPGGEAILQGCGIDASELFNNRPNDKGAHSEKARGFLVNYYIGDLAK